MPIGTCVRVRLVEELLDEATSIVPGEEGTATGYDPETERYEVQWDNGSRQPVRPENVVTLTGRYDAHLQ